MTHYWLHVCSNTERYISRERGDCSSAIPLLEKCISVEPNQERAYPLLSDCLFSQNTPQQQRSGRQVAVPADVLEAEKPAHAATAARMVPEVNLPAVNHLHSSQKQMADTSDF